MEEMKVGPGMYVAYTYRLYDDNTGKLLFEAKPEAPDVMIYGISNDVVPGLTAVLKDLKKEDKFEITLPPEAAFGQRFEENVVDLDKNIFMRDGKLAEEVKIGAELPMMTAEGYRILGRILEIGDDKIKMDFNHPFAGLTVRFDGEVRNVREATPEELQPSCGCCCGHDHGDCSDGCCGDQDEQGGGCCGHGCC